MDDLRAFTRELMKDAERDLDTKLDWIAVDHWNTDHPHIHVLVRGKADDGQDLVISRDYISRGFGYMNSRSTAPPAVVAIEPPLRPPHRTGADLRNACCWTTAAK